MPSILDMNEETHKTESCYSYLASAGGRHEVTVQLLYSGDDSEVMVYWWCWRNSVDEVIVFWWCWRYSGVEIMV